MQHGGFRNSASPHSGPIGGGEGGPNPAQDLLNFSPGVAPRNFIFLQIYKKVYRERLKRSKWDQGIERIVKFARVARVRSLYPAKFFGPKYMILKGVGSIGRVGRV